MEIVQMWYVNHTNKTITSGRNTDLQARFFHKGFVSEVNKLVKEFYSGYSICNNLL